MTQAATRWRLDLRTPVHRAGDGWVGGDASDGATLVHHHDSDDGTVPIHLLWTAVVPAPGLARVTDDLRFVAHLSLAREHAILVQLQLGDPADHQRWFANIQAEVAVGAGREQRIVVPWSAFARVAGPGPVLDTSIYRVLILTGGDPGELVVHDLSLERP